jgi:hypothetical protein
MIQFPWRLLGIGWLAISIAVGLAWANLLDGVPVASGVAAVAFACCACSVTLPLAKLEPMNEARVRDTSSKIRATVSSTTGVDEYLPKAVERAPRRSRKALLEPNEYVTVHSEFDFGFRNTLNVTTSRAGTYKLALHHFPGWFIESASGPGTVSYAPTRGRAGLQFSNPGRYELVLVFGNSPIRRIAGSTSLMAVLLLFPMLLAIAVWQPASFRRFRHAGVRAHDMRRMPAGTV